jgi:hypothetical protein
MTAFLSTLAALGLMLLTIRALLRHSRFAIGIAIGTVLALVLAPFAWSALKAGFAAGELPVWLPPLPFAIVALTLFGFGLAAWFLSED